MKNKAEFNIINRTNCLIDKAHQIAETKYNRTGSDMVNRGEMDGFRAAGLSFIESLYGKSHSYYSGFQTSTDKNYFNSLIAGEKILTSIRDEIENGWMASYSRFGFCRYIFRFY